MSPSADGRPIFVEIADQIADDILVGLYAEETQVPSTTELSVHYRINPATAGKALNRLVDEGIVYKRAGDVRGYRGAGCPAGPSSRGFHR